MHNSIESGKSWRTPRIRVKGSDRRPFILILDWMLVNATLIMWMNLAPYPNFCKAGKTKSHPMNSIRGFYSVHLTQYVNI